MKNKIIIILVILAIILLASSIYFYMEYNEISQSFRDWYYGHTTIVQNQLIQDDIWIKKNDKWWVQADYIVSNLDNRLHYSNTRTRIYIPSDCVSLRMENDYLDEWVYTRVKSINLPILNIDKKKYICVDDLMKVYSVQHKYFAKTDVHFLYSTNSDICDIKTAKVTKPYKIYNNPTLDSVIMGKISVGNKFYKLSNKDEFAFIISDDGQIGYIVDDIKLNYVDLDIQSQKLREQRQDMSLNYPIRLSWQQAYSYRPFEGDMKYSPSEGIDIVAPTWFEMNVDGIVLNIADMDYVKKAHEKGFQVWPTFTNHFDPKWTHAMLGSRENKDRIISQILIYCALYDLDGINIDFENMYLKDKQAFVEFVDELSEQLHNQGMMVSIDVTVPDGSDMWSKVYDRQALIEHVDFMMLMAYDEHWGSSPVAGSVASKDWVIKGIEKTLTMVPNDKLVLGVPFYSRIWTQKSSGKVRSKAVGAKGQKNWLEKTGAEVTYDEITGQNYAESVVGGQVQKIWLEDSTSLAMRIELAKKHKLAGIAGWSQSFTTDETWNQIQEEYGQ